MITSSFYKGAHGVMLAYDTTSQETLAPLKGWDGDVDRYHGNPSIVAKMVVGTKKDLAEQRTVTPEEGQAMAAAIGKDVLFAETSVYDRDSVLVAFQRLLDAAYAKYKVEEEKRKKAAEDSAGEAGDVVHVKKASSQKKKKKTCVI